MNHPIFNFFRRRSMDKLSFEELKKKVEGGELDDIIEGGGAAAPPAASGKSDAAAGANGDATEDERNGEAGVGGSQSFETDVEVINEVVGGTTQFPLEEIVLKFTTLSEGNEAPAFLVGMGGASIGRDPTNEVSVPTDATLEPERHAVIEYRADRQAFYLRDMGHDHGAAIRIEAGSGLRQWRLQENAVFSAGNSSFKVVTCDASSVLLEVGSGPLKGERRRVGEKGATLGRHNNNEFSIPDKELSRRHCCIEFEPKDDSFYICDVGSTNGTYMHLVGPYRGLWRLSLSDHILVGRTGFSVNRYDFGVSEEMGRRQSMEDAHVLIQDLDLRRLNAGMLGPVFFAGVFDGHGGDATSAYLSAHLHANLARALEEEASTLVKAFKKDTGFYGGAGAHRGRSQSFIADMTDFLASVMGGSGEGSDEGYSQLPLPPPVPRPHATPSGTDEGNCNFRLGGDLDRRVSHLMRRVYEETDGDISRKEDEGKNMAGSTATTILILRDRIWLANVGDSRTLLCRGGRVHAFTLDHKPDRADETARIKAAGGFVIHHRVLGELAVSRAFGDAEYKKGIQQYVGQDDLNSLRQGGLMGGDAEADYSRPILTAEPEIQSLKLAPEDEFIVLACDGLFDVFTNEEVVQAVRAEMAQHQDAQQCVESLSRRAIHERNCRDNVTIVLIILKPKFWEA
mmetsp:Transcript_40564/g.126901  ORF Transcript_40564/g.126901 Transcript_40564/m.126901 type:complete len:682 (+) Transcript_40564:228-2273(+)